MLVLAARIWINYAVIAPVRPVTPLACASGATVWPTTCCQR